MESCCSACCLRMGERREKQVAVNSEPIYCSIHKPQGQIVHITFNPDQPLTHAMLLSGIPGTCTREAPGISVDPPVSHNRHKATIDIETTPNTQLQCSQSMSHATNHASPHLDPRSAGTPCRRQNHATRGCDAAIRGPSRGRRLHPPKLCSATRVLLPSCFSPL
ncbi:hypothetical protein P170DRAFT_95150 [Aspergillus steynii IBT 23096]|uniref:Uncharacterized protein n=1 Tax=Aspergillus steynii IBT 23096 TaxID=1392250 RepID=A0A2I2GGI5_9EURO|nr:uncharacterized protein P170DRAFT_95150 [Aspergillus steynii IBT 23096]PLB52001.1 hypothetical protein P170DRAFT_95150 [Aspergillus steynii IBT 23096]